MSEALQQEIRHLRTLEGSARDPRDRIFLPLADAHHRHGDFAAAEEMLREGLTRHPDLVAAHVLKARVHEARGDLDEAEETWAAARRLDPGNAEALLALGRILVHRGEAMGADLILRARALDPTAGGQEPDADLVSVADLAPDDRDGVVPVAELAPDEDVVSIADLAPDEQASVSAPAAPEGPESESPAPATVEPAATADEPDPGPERVEPRTSPAAPRGDRRVVTRTLAELLAGQGQRDRAIEMYEELVARSPHDPVLRDRLDELRRTGEPAATEARPSEPAATEAGTAGQGTAEPAATGAGPSGPGGTEPLGADAGDEVDDRDHVDHRIARPDPDPETPTPFAWTGDDGDDDGHPADGVDGAARRSGAAADAAAAAGEESTGESSISDYLGGLLSRSPRPSSGDASGS